MQERIGVENPNIGDVVYYNLEGRRQYCKILHIAGTRIVYNKGIVNGKYLYGFWHSDIKMVYELFDKYEKVKFTPKKINEFNMGNVNFGFMTNKQVYLYKTCAVLDWQKEMRGR